MIVTVVGSGTLVPHPRRSTPALHIHAGDTRITVDGGSGTMRRQAELGLDYSAVDWLCYTHIHPDHTLDLLHFLFASGYHITRRDPVRVVGPKGFGAFMDHLRDGVRSWTAGGEGGIEVEELSGGGHTRLGPLDVDVVELHHSVTDLGYRFTDAQGRCLAFTGDTGWGPRLLDLARNVDLLICECSAVEAAPMDGHLTAAQAGRLAREAGVGQLVLTHLYPLEDDRVRISEAARHFPGPVHLSRDGDRFQV